MRKKITTLLVAGALVALPALAQNEVPMKVVGEMNIHTGGKMHSKGVLHAGISSTGSNGKIVNNGTLNLPKGIVFASNNVSDGMLHNKGTVNLSSTQSDVKVIKTFTDVDLYYSISFPFDVKVSDITGYGSTQTFDNDFFLVKYLPEERANKGHHDDAWPWIEDASTILKAGEGYLLYPTREMTLVFPAVAGTGNMYATPDRSNTLTFYSGVRTQLDHGWNFIGNLQTTTFDTKSTHLNDYAGSVYYYERATDSWNAYDLDADFGDDVKGSPFTGFFTQFLSTNTGDTYSLVFEATGRSVIDSPFEFRAPQPAAEGVNMVELTLNKDSYSDHLRVIMGDKYTNSFRIGEDAVKMVSTTNRLPQFYSLLDGDAMVFNKMQVVNKDIPLGIIAKEEGEYAIALNRLMGFQNYNVKLIDTKLNVEHDILAGDYVFTAEAAKDNDRFILRITENTTDLNIADNSDVIVYAENDVVYVRNIEVGDNVSVYNIAGQLISQVVATSEEASSNLPGTGVYLVKVSGSKAFTTKVLNQ